MKKILCFIVLMAFTAFMQSAMAGDQTASSPTISKERTFHPFHKKLADKCTKCHVTEPGQDKPTEATKFKCADCHGTPDEMAQDSKDNGLKGPKNPHTSIHFGTSLPCEECHKEHSEPIIYCERCHRTIPMSIPGESYKHKTVE